MAMYRIDYHTAKRAGAIAAVQAIIAEAGKLDRKALCLKAVR